MLCSHVFLFCLAPTELDFGLFAVQTLVPLCRFFNYDPRGLFVSPMLESPQIRHVVVIDLHGQTVPCAFAGLVYGRVSIFVPSPSFFFFGELGFLFFFFPFFSWFSWPSISLSSLLPLVVFYLSSWPDWTTLLCGLCRPGFTLSFSYLCVP